MDALVPYRKEYDELGGDSVDAWRLALARRIAIYFGTQRGYWRGCRHANCRRQRMCTAPDIRCANRPPRQPDPDGRLWRAGFMRLRHIFERMEAEGKFDEPEPDAHPEQRHGRARPGHPGKERNVPAQAGSPGRARR